MRSVPDFVQLDVTDDASVAEAVKTVGSLDVLVNNAGISGGRISPSEATADNMRTVYETNTATVHHYLDALGLLQQVQGTAAPVP